MGIAMADQWLCLIDGQKIGPVTFTRLQQLADAGRLLGRRAGLTVGIARGL